MQLKRVVLGLVSAALLTISTNARAEGTTTTKIKSEVSAYQDSVAVSVLTPAMSASVESPTSGWNVAGNALVDVVSAASPDIVSTASPRWMEVRKAGGLSAGYKPGDFGAQGSFNVSHTDDYLSLTGGGRLTLDVDEKHMTLVAGYYLGHDVIGRTGTPFSVFSRTLDTHSLSFGLTRIVTKSTLASLSADVILERGDQSKPYRYVPMFAPGVAATVPAGASPDFVANARIAARPLEQLPLARERYALTGRIATHGGFGTLRAEERLYADSWALLASTTDVRVFFDVGSRLEIGPHGRFHVQKAVSFWERAYTASGPGDIPALRTGDRELGALLTAGGGLGMRLHLGPVADANKLALTFNVDGYTTSFFDAIYVTNRLTVFSALGLEAVF